MTGGKWFDAAGKPNPAQAARQGFEGAFLYFGTPGFAKNCTAAYYAAVRAAGLAAIGVVEHNAHDAELGAAAGASYAQAALADMATQGAIGIPLGVTADEHLTAGQIPTATAFQAAASHLIRAAGRQAMGYGFMEFIHALRPAGLVDIEWQAGALSVVDSLTHFWQDNTGTEQVGGVTVDRDWQRRPLPGGTMDWNDPLPNPLYDKAVTDPADVRSHPAYTAAQYIQGSWVRTLNIGAEVAQVDTDVKAIHQITPADLQQPLHDALTALGWTPPPTTTDTATAVLTAIKTQLTK